MFSQFFFLRAPTRFSPFLHDPIARFIHTTAPLAAGHSKWANIRHIKAAKDAEKSKIFAKLARQIRIAIQERGSDPAGNSTLRTLIEQAQKNNMPAAKIKEIIQKSKESKSNLQYHFFEAKALGKICLVFAAYSDQPTVIKNSITANLKKVNGSLVNVKHLFDENGVVQALAPETVAAEALEEKATEDAIECGAEELEVLDPAQRLVMFTCPPAELNRLSGQLNKHGYTVESAEHVFAAKQPITLNEAEQEAYKKFREKLQYIDGIEEIFDNVEQQINE